MTCAMTQGSKASEAAMFIREYLIRKLGKVGGYVILR